MSYCTRVFPSTPTRPCVTARVTGFRDCTFALRLFEISLVAEKTDVEYKYTVFSSKTEIEDGMDEAMEIACEIYSTRNKDEAQTGA